MIELPVIDEFRVLSRALHACCKLALRKATTFTESTAAPSLFVFLGSHLRLPQFANALGSVIDNSPPRLVLELFPLLAFFLGTQATNAQSCFFVEFTDADAR